MKNQYFGDVGNYGKYGLLRFIAKRGVSIAVNWYLTTDDRSNDGNIRGYLDRDTDRIYDPELFDVLRDMRTRKENDVKCFANRGLIPGAIYFDSIVRPLPSDLNLILAEKQLARERWHQEALAACDSSDLVFLDPDNGLKAYRPTARKDAPKYVYASEVRAYYDRGQDVVYYCHKGRRAEAQWEKAKRIMLKDCPDAELMGITYHRGTQRSYVFVIHPAREKQYRILLKSFLETAWSDCFTEEIIQS